MSTQFRLKASLLDTGGTPENLTLSQLWEEDSTVCGEPH